VVHYHGYEPDYWFTEETMKSMTVHKMDDLLLEAIKERAEARGESLNATIKELLAQAVGLEDSKDNETRATGYRRFLGLWTAEEAAAFESATEDFERIDASDWTP
jgi:plasmid stability protein